MYANPPNNEPLHRLPDASLHLPTFQVRLILSYPHMEVLNDVSMALDLHDDGQDRRQRYAGENLPHIFCFPYIFPESDPRASILVVTLRYWITLTEEEV